MDLTGNREEDLIIVSQLYIHQVKKLLTNKAYLALLLADYLNRDQEYKNELFLWIVENDNNIHEKDQVETIEYLIDNGANIHAKDNNNDWTALLWASSRGNKDIVNLLLEKGAYINAQNINDNMGLIFASI